MSSPIKKQPFNLPEPVVRTIFSFLKAEDIQNAEAASKLAHAILSQDQVWKTVSQNLKLPDQPKGKEIKWKDYVIQYYKQSNDFALKFIKSQGYEDEVKYESDLLKQNVLITEFLKSNPSILLGLMDEAYKQKQLPLLDSLAKDFASLEDNLFNPLKEASVNAQAPLPIVELLVKYVDKDSFNSQDTLAYAVSMNKIDLAKALLKSGIKGTPTRILGNAISLGSLAMVKLILESGVKVQKIDIEDATDRGRQDMVDELNKYFTK